MSMLDKFEKLKEQDPTKYPTRMGQSWSEEEMRKAHSSIREGKPIEQIANEHQRTIGSIVAIQKRMVLSLYDNNSTLSEIAKATSLSKEDVEYIILNRDKSKPKKETNEIKEILILASEIQMKMAMLMEKVAKITK